MKILIAEDDPIMLMLLEHHLSKEHYTISAHANAREALQAIETFDPNLIITDILMPFTSGLELISIIRSTDSKTPILVLSAMDQETTVMEALSLGANDFITKPFNGPELATRVKKLLVKKK